MRFIIELLISRKIDDGKPLGKGLSWFVRHDGRIRRFYADALRLSVRLERDAADWLEYTARDRLEKPFQTIGRSSVFAPSKKSSRRARSFAAALFSISMLIVLVTGVLGTVFHADVTSVTNAAYAGESSDAERPVIVSAQRDPRIYEELIQLCRRSPNETGPFFSGSAEMEASSRR